MQDYGYWPRSLDLNCGFGDGRFTSIWQDDVFRAKGDSGGLQDLGDGLIVAADCYGNVPVIDCI